MFLSMPKLKLRVRDLIKFLQPMKAEIALVLGVMIMTSFIWAGILIGVK